MTMRKFDRDKACVAVQGMMGAGADVDGLIAWGSDQFDAGVAAGLDSGTETIRALREKVAQYEGLLRAKALHPEKEA